jgi:transcriptional regulator with XRE-family HTH domain
MRTFNMEYDQFCSALGEELRRIREEAGLSQQQLADRVGIHRNSVANYEGGMDVPVMTFIRLCVAMGASCSETLERTFVNGTKGTARK